MRLSAFQQMMSPEELARAGVTDDELVAHATQPRQGHGWLVMALIAMAIAAAVAMTVQEARASAHTDESPLPEAQQCRSFEEFSSKYPDSKFTKLSPDEVTAFINKFPDPSNRMVVLYSTPFPKDPSFTNVFGYSIEGCFLTGAQLPTAQFETVIHGGEI